MEAQSIANQRVIDGLRVEVPFIRHRAFAGAGDEFGVFREDSVFIAGLRLRPLGFSGGDFFVGEVHGNAVFDGVDLDLIAFLKDGDGAAFESFRGDVTDDEAVAASGENGVRVQNLTEIPAPLRSVHAKESPY